MTLIARYEVADVPILLGDLLVSSAIPPEKPLLIPTRGDVFTNPDKSIHPTSLLQKICIINDNLMVAWSGSVIVAKTVLSAFKEKFSNKLVDEPSIQSVVDDIGGEYLKGTQFIGLAKHKEGGLTRFSYRDYTFEHAYFGQCHVGGSGADRFMEVLRESGPLDIAGGSAGDTDLAISHALTTAQTFLARELFSEEIVAEELFEEQFGGGFEVGVLTINGAEKVGDILHLIWTWDENNDAVPKLMPTFIKSDYIGKDLVVRRLHQV